jgi:hypothetical protein
MGLLHISMWFDDALPPQVEDMDIVEHIVAVSEYTEFKHPEYGTVMRMMAKDVAFTPKALPAPQAAEL